MQMDPNDLKDVICSCGSVFWIEARRAKYVPAMLSPNGQATIGPVPQLLCMACGKMIEECLTEEDTEEKSPLIL